MTTADDRETIVGDRSTSRINTTCNQRVLRSVVALWQGNYQVPSAYTVRTENIGLIFG
jgi:hypothetical protein